MRKVPDIWKLREIQISEGLRQPVGPGVRKYRIMLGPADAGRYFDLRQLGRLSFNDRDAACMCPFVVSKSSFQIARLQEVVDEDVEDIVKHLFAPGPVAKEVAKVCFAGLAVGATSAGAIGI